jgi:hypothetical protein
MSPGELLLHTPLPLPSPPSPLIPLNAESSFIMNHASVLAPHTISVPSNSRVAVRIVPSNETILIKLECILTFALVDVAYAFPPLYLFFANQTGLVDEILRNNSIAATQGHKSSSKKQTRHSMDPALKLRASTLVAVSSSSIYPPSTSFQIPH